MSILSPTETKLFKKPLPPNTLHASAEPEVHQESTPKRRNSATIPEAPIELRPSKLRQLLTAEPRPYVCIHCGKAYVRQRAYEIHMQEHTVLAHLDIDLSKKGSKSKLIKRSFAYKCLYCGFEFPTSAAALEDGSHDSASCVTTILRRVPSPKYHGLRFP